VVIEPPPRIGRDRRFAWPIRVVLCWAHAARCDLSFSTKGSAKHKLVDKVVEQRANRQHCAPQLEIDGELQADAALVLRSPNQRAGSPLSGVRCLIFSDLQSGNIALQTLRSGWGGTAWPNSQDWINC